MRVHCLALMEVCSKTRPKYNWIVGGCTYFSFEAKDAMNTDFREKDWLSLILGGLLYLKFCEWFFSKSYTFRVVVFLIALAISHICITTGLRP